MDKFKRMAVNNIVVGIVWLLHATFILFDGLVFNLLGTASALTICIIAVLAIMQVGKQKGIKKYDLIQALGNAFVKLRIAVLAMLSIVLLAVIVLGLKDIKADINVVISMLMGLMDVFVGLELMKTEKRLRIDSGERISNYEAIVRMNIDELECFLDEVYLTGLNEGMYAAKQDEKTKEEILCKFPYDKSWLEESAESAVFYRFDSYGEDLYCTDED